MIAHALIRVKFNATFFQALTDNTFKGSKIFFFESSSL